MKIEKFTEEDIREAAELAYPVWGEGHSANGNGREFGLLMCEYIVRYGWYSAPFAFKMVNDEGRMVACILAGDHTKENGYNNWFNTIKSRFNEQQRAEAYTLRDYFARTAPKVYGHMEKGKDLYLSFFISSLPGCGKQLLQEVMELARSKGYRALYLWTDSSCNHSYYARNSFVKVAEFKSDEWKTSDSDYLTYIYRRDI